MSLNPQQDPLGLRQPTYHGPINILIRAESDDPWSQERHNLQLHVLQPNPQYGLFPEPVDIRESPYIFPPSSVTEVMSTHGSLRCTEIKLEPFGTAIWVHPRDRAATGLIPADINTPFQRPRVPERLVAAVFPGRLTSAATSQTKALTVWMNEMNDWTCMDYSEALGRVLLGSSSGTVTILEL